MISSFLIRRLLLFAFGSIFFLQSCVVQRQIEYLRDDSNAVKEFTEAEFPDYTLKASDQLYIQVSSLDESAVNIFSNTLSQTASFFGTIQPYGASLMSYSIDRDGFLYLPVIGNIYAKGKTLSQLSLVLKDSLRHILSQPLVTVKLVNSYVSVVGEVRNPGHYVFSQDKLSIFDAISLAGDITEYGNRERVALVRNNEGSNLKAILNLTSPDILTSEFYYIRPNDLIYIKPLRNKFWGLRQIPLTVFLSALTTGLLMYNIITRNY
ncbi:MAG TPA: polysaccharide biosynthesis/export family protein [Bacteroidales bacterium]|nr:polysaccharide biosynthesis/export family protein [Bacteroidales bacterium]